MRAPQYVEIPKDVNHHREIETEVQALGYGYQWRRKRSRVWRDSRYLPAFTPDLHGEGRPAEEPRAPTRTNGGLHPGAATLGNFRAVTRRPKTKPRLLPLKRSGPSSDAESAQRGGPSASSSSSAPQRGEVVCTCERICGVPSGLPEKWPHS